MAIKFTKYIDITSGVGGGAAAARRDLGLRVFTSNPVMTYGAVLVCNDADEVMNVFGDSSNEYSIASKYFGYVSNSITKAKQISFVRWADRAIKQTTITGNVDPKGLDSFTGKIGIKFTLTGTADPVNILVNIGEDEIAESYASVAEKLSVKMLQAASATAWMKGSSCEYTKGRFVFTFTSQDNSPTTGPDVTIGKYSGNDTDVTNETDLFGLTIVSPATAPGTTDKTASIAIETPEKAVSRVEGSENNFGSFMFVEELADSKIEKVAAWTDGKNYEYLYCVPCTSSDYSDISSKIKNKTCVNLTYGNRRDEYVETMPAALFASTDYTRVNSTKTFMFKQFTGVQPSVGLKNESLVNGNALYKVLDNARVNYYGQTMKSGKSLCFYQDGNNMDGIETSVACNEIWMKDAIKTEIINLLVAMEKVPANDKGLAMITMMVNGVIGEALQNGTICPGKTLTNTQKIYIDTVTGTADAWKDVYSNGYWFGIELKTVESGAGTKYKADYTLVYSKGDAIRKVTGSDIMI